jgi:hypothetical protein
MDCTIFDPPGRGIPLIGGRSVFLTLRTISAIMTDIEVELEGVHSLYFGRPKTIDSAS